MSLVRFVHTADLHLDRQFRGIRGIPRRIAKLTYDATFETFQRIVDFSIDQQADALLIVGDVYDGADRSLRAQLGLIEGLERLDAAGIRGFICHGHADPMDDWTSRLQLPPSAHRFGPDPEAVPLGRNGLVEVVGISDSGALPFPNLPQSLADMGSTPYTIGMFHGEIDRWREVLPGLPVAYWALGMRHKRRIVQASKPYIVYPGTPQAAEPVEAGPRGVYLVDIEEDGATTVRFHALDAIRWATLDVDISGVASEADLLALLKTHVERRIKSAQGRPLLYQIACRSNRTDIQSTGGIVARLNEAFGDRSHFAWCYRMQPLTPSLPDREKRLQADDLVAHLLRVSEDLSVDSDLHQRLWDSLSVLLREEPFVRHHVAASISIDDLPAIVRQAEVLAIKTIEMQA